MLHILMFFNSSSFNSSQKILTFGMYSTKISLTELIIVIEVIIGYENTL